MQSGMCHVQGFVDGEDRGRLQVILTLLSTPPFLFPKQLTDAWKAWPFAVILFFVLFFSCTRLFIPRGRQLFSPLSWVSFTLLVQQRHYANGLSRKVRGSLTLIGVSSHSLVSRSVVSLATEAK